MSHRTGKAMKYRDAHVVRQGAINTLSEVTLVPGTEDGDTEKLRLALALVDRYKKAALRALKTSEKSADWTRIEYAVKNDCVVVTVDQGMAG